MPSGREGIRSLRAVVVRAAARIGAAATPSVPPPQECDNPGRLQHSCDPPAPLHQVRSREPAPAGGVCGQREARSVPHRTAGGGVQEAVRVGRPGVGVRRDQGARRRPGRRRRVRCLGQVPAADHRAARAGGGDAYPRGGRLPPGT